MALFSRGRRFRLDDAVRRRGRAAFIRHESTRFGLAVAVVKSAVDVWSGPPATAVDAEWTWLVFRVTLHLLAGLAAGCCYARSMWWLSERNQT